MNQHIKEMGEEYKKQRGNKRKLQKFETPEEGTTIFCVPSIYR